MHFETREDHATHILRTKFGLEVIPVPTSSASGMLFCFDPTNLLPTPNDGSTIDTPKPGFLPNAIVSRNEHPGDGMPAWGCLSYDKLSRPILKALNTGAV
jgi:hypothetical protein